MNNKQNIITVPELSQTGEPALAPKALKAVLLKYFKKLPLPVVTGKGKGVFAERLIEKARKEQIPVIKDDVCERLALLETDSYISDELIEIIAGIYAGLNQLARQRSV